MERVCLFEEVAIEGKGLGLRAVHDIPSGQVLLRESPCGFSLCPDLFARVCRGCCEICDECFSHPVVCLCSSHYCSVACREADAVNHSGECLLLQHFVLHRNEWSEIGSDDETFLLCMMSLLDRRKSISNLSILDRAECDPSLEQLLDLATRLCGIVGMARPPTLAEWTLLCQQEQNNSFGLFDASDFQDDLYCFGRAVYERASRFNHSCLPNVTRLRTGRAMVFVTSRPVKAGEELCITYTSLGLEKENRQTSLGNDYGFICNCVRCLDPEDPPFPVCDRCGGETLNGLCVHHERKSLLEMYKQ